MPIVEDEATVLDELEVVVDEAVVEERLLDSDKDGLEVDTDDMPVDEVAILDDEVVALLVVPPPFPPLLHPAPIVATRTTPGPTDATSQALPCMNGTPTTRARMLARGGVYATPGQLDSALTQSPSQSPSSSPPPRFAARAAPPGVFDERLDALDGMLRVRDRLAGLAVRDFFEELQSEARFSKGNINLAHDGVDLGRRKSV